MDEHPEIAFISTPRGRRAVLAVRPRLQVVDIVGTWKGERRDIKVDLDNEIRRHLDAQQNYKRLL